ncbi:MULTISPECIES: SPFH domain-containing protein [unclassified Novosphingobium]|uniref:SPFH domain-containing protein n=1 Tax=unclassified Novosphingobium TaxID=2644732 RepID=UPI00146B6CC3|nr:MULTISPECIES: SPFH domain-containing protein [unclassified Novosphingobium]NMN02905.1 putative membrane protein YqiK [Novosphingobium sp. SG919]NMN87108.1 putative membrane protein YqiK [Novosphingobium sp. SG916]
MPDSIMLGSGAVLVAFVFVLFVASRCVRYVGNNRVAVVEKLWSGAGSITDGLIALRGEAGFQPDVLRGGYHFFFPFQYRIHSQPLVTIPQGQIGYVFARDGAPLGPTQTLASNARTADFLDVRAFLSGGGQKGPQRTILREGTYAINSAQFVIVTRDRIYGLMLSANDGDLFDQMQALIAGRNGFEAVVIKDSSDQIGIVTVHDGPALNADHIIAPEVGTEQSDAATFHNSFQDPEKFIAAGGRRGRQLQVLVEGSYYINRLFATVEMVAKTVIEVGHVGVVISYTGNDTADTSGDDYRHGELVARGSRGVWSEPLLPGKYAFNTYAGKILIVPTTNFILKWESDTIGQHKFDENLSEVSLITRDAFEPTLPLSVVVHIDYRKAPLVVQRFGDIKKLVEQTLDPMVSAYFKNIAQKKTLIELLQERSDIQEQAGAEMRTKFATYNLEMQEVLIGTPRASAGNDQIEKVLQQLRERQVAEERVTTYEKQRIAAEGEKALREAEARANQQTAITQSELSIIVRENEGKAALRQATQQAEQTRTLAKAEGERVRLIGEGEAAKMIALAAADAERITKTGLATAETIAKQVEASGGAHNQLTRQIVERLAEALEKSGVDIVPRIQISTGSDGAAGGGPLAALIGMMLGEKGQDLLAEQATAEPAQTH